LIDFSQGAGQHRFDATRGATTAVMTAAMMVVTADSGVLAARAWGLKGR
jgi:hypothetical protein